MDDEDSKTRRNLIVISVLMILVWWLQAPLDRVSEKFFGVVPSGPAFEWRVWLAAALSLGYFALRFRFSSDHEEAVKVLTKEVDGLESRFLRRWIASEIGLFLRWGRYPKSLGNSFAPVIERATKATDYNEFVAPGQGEAISAIRVGSAHAGMWTSGRFVPTHGKYQVRIEVHTRRTDGSGRAFEESINFSFGRMRRFVLWLGSRTWLLVYSKTGSSLLIPWALATGAAVVAAWKLAVSW